MSAPNSPSIDPSTVKPDMTGTAVTSLIFGILGFGALFMEAVPADVSGLYLIIGVCALTAIGCGRSALHSAQRGLAVAGLILGLLVGAIGGLGAIQNRDAIDASIQYHQRTR